MQTQRKNAWRGEEKQTWRRRSCSNVESVMIAWFVFVCFNPLPSVLYFHLFFSLLSLLLPAFLISQQRKDEGRNSLCSLRFFSPNCLPLLCFFSFWISWASDIKIKRFKSPNLSTYPGLQLWWRIQSEIKSF